MRRGSTLVEQLFVITLLGILTAITAAAGMHLVDAIAVHAASRDVADLFALARDNAISSGQRTAVHLDAVRGRVIVHADTDTLTQLDLAERSAVRFSTSRDSMAYASSGLGYGAANLRLIVSRGTAEDTVTVSRLGRVRR